jgi:alpha-2-macroglobulin
MKTYISNLVVAVFFSMQVAVGFTQVEASQETPENISSEHFVISKIIPARPHERRVTLKLDHVISYPALIGWFKRDKPKIMPRLELDWGISYTNRNEITLRGDFREGQRYSLIFKPGFEIDGKKYKPTKSSFIIEPLSEISFFNTNNVIERNSKQLLHLNLKNVDRFTVHSMQIPPIYLPFALDPSTEWEETLKELTSYHADREYEEFPEEFRGLWGPLVNDKQIFSFQKSYKEKSFSIPLTYRRDSDKGSIQLVKVSSEHSEPTAKGPYKLVRITDIGITYKRSSKNLLIWLTSIQKGNPLDSKKVYALDDQSQIFYLGRTNSDGVIIVEPGILEAIKIERHGRYTINKRHLDVSRISALVALSHDDTSFIEINKGDEFYPGDIQREKHDGKPQKLIKARIFTERGIYKPGDMVFFKGTLRKYSNGNISPYQNETPVRIENPKGETVLQSTYVPTEFGTLSGNLRLEAHFPLGTYTIFMGSEDAYVTTRTFELQEFRAPKHKTRITFDTETRKDKRFANIERETKYLKIKIAGQYYVGGPLKNAQVRWKIFHGKTRFKVKGYDKFRFENSEAEEELIESSETILDKNGNAEFSFPIDSLVTSGKRSLVVVASVIDFDGRVATSKSVYQGKPDYLVGMSKHSNTVKAGLDLPVRFVVLNNEGTQIQEGKVKVEVLRKGWNYIRKRNERGEVYWNWQKLWKKVFSAEHEIRDSENPFIFSNSNGGDYLFTASFSSNGKTFTSGTILQVEDGYSSHDRRNRLNPYERISLISDKVSYAPGTTAGVKFRPAQKSPAYLVTIEREGVLDYSLLKTEEDQPSLDVPLNDSHAPNIHVSILGALPRKTFPHYPSSIDEGAPNFQYGAIKLQVLKESDNLKIVVNNGAYSITQKPSSTGTLQVSVKDKNGTGKAVELAIGIIDEKVLALTRYKSPDLSSLSRIEIPLGVGTADLRSWLSKQTPLKMIWNKPLTGGGGLEKSTASDTIIRSDFNPVAYFNPSVVTDSSGNVTIEYELPDSITSYRVYIVACDKGNGFGKAELPLFAAKDFYIEPGLPRFFSRGDRFDFLVKAINNSGAGSSLEFMSDATDNLRISQQGEDYYLDAKDSTQIRINGEALSTGVATVHFSGTLGGKTDAVQLEVPVHSGHTIGTDVLIGSFRGNTRLTLPLDRALKKKFQKDEFIDNSDLKLTFSKSPFLRMSGGIAYLLQYPYGCIEQTSSRLMPLVALRGLLGEGQIPEIKAATTDKYIKAGVDRLFMMQTESGGFGYWPGNKNPHKMGTLYAMAALSIAKKNGVDVPKERMQKSVSYLQDLLNTDESLSETFMAFGSYVLSLNNAFKPSPMNLFRRVRGRSTEAEMFMLLARNNSGAPKQAKPNKKFWNILYPKKLDIIAPSNLGEFNAKHRHKAVALLAANSIDPDHPLAHRMAKALLRGMESGGFWTSTSDTGWALYALGEYYKNQKTSIFPANINVSWGDYSSSEVLEGQKFKTIDLNISSNLTNPTLKLKSGTSDPVYYKATLKYPRLGYAESGHSNGFQVRKIIENQSGSGDIHVGDIVKVKVDIDVKGLSYNKPYSYVVVDDPLPSGLVAINSAIKTEEQVDKQDDESSYWNSDGTYKLVPNFVEFKDDRVLVFKDRMHWNGTYRYTYYARAIMEGDFALPSTKVQLMYSPQVSGFTPKNRIQISER